MNDASKPGPRGRTDDAAALVTQVMAEREAERQRLARLLHREVSGMLAAARMDLSRAIARIDHEAEVQPLLHRVDQMLDQVIRDARLEMQRLHPALLDHFGLSAALRHRVEETCRERNVRYTLVLDEAFDAVDASLPIALYRLVEVLLDEPGLAQFDARIAQRRGGYEVALTRRVASGGAVRAAKLVPALAALRLWVRSLGASWTESGQGEAGTVTVRIPVRVPASPPATETPRSEAPGG